MTMESPEWLNKAKKQEAEIASWKKLCPFDLCSDIVHISKMDGIVSHMDVFGWDLDFSFIFKAVIYSLYF